MENVGRWTCFVSGITNTTDGPVCLISHQLAHALERTFSSFVYIAVFDDGARRFGGEQCITTAEEYVIPLNICNRLPGLDLQTPSDDEWRGLPHIVTSSDEEWDPSKFDD